MPAGNNTMSNNEVAGSRSTNNRTERRYLTAKNGFLRCKSSLKEGCSSFGTVIDLSTTGMRLICEGRFEVGQTIFTELMTDRSHGRFKAFVRRVTPWADGQSVLGCSLNDSIPESVLRDLAKLGVVSRRSHDRLSACHSAKLSWPLHYQEIPVMLQDYSTGGISIISSVSIPKDVPLRIRLDLGDQDGPVVLAKSIWSHESDDICLVGAEFTCRDSSAEVARAFSLDDAFDDVCS